jgi:hypothetical protein
MGTRRRIVSNALLGLLLVAFLGLGQGCASTRTIASRITGPPHLDWFGQPDPDDAWSPKIAGWQHRERADDGRVRPAVAADGESLAAQASREAEAFEPGPSAESLVPESRTLRSKYFGFRAERKREMAREFASWIQSQAPHHYIEDGPTDHWATLEETLRRNGDDCDGLELLTFHGLRDLGFDEGEVFRAIVYRKSDNQHHMVTLWFEDAEDPWVIDPTGAMTLGMPRMSSLPGWAPLKLFSDDREYTVREAGAGSRSERLAQHR